MKHQTPEQKKIDRTVRIVEVISLSTWLVVSLAFLLTGCSTTSETFDSKPGEGVGAKSITEVNAMVDRGELPRTSQGGAGMGATLAPVFSHGAPQTVNVEAIELSNKTLIYRQPEKHLRVWIAPYQDSQGHLHEGSLIHALTMPGYWQLGQNPFYHA